MSSNNKKNIESSRFRYLDDFLSSGEIITSDRIMRSVKMMPDALYYKRDFLFRSGQWRGEKVSRLSRKRSAIRGKVVVLGHSDLSIKRQHITFLKLIGARNVIGFNYFPTKSVRYGIPLGVTNHTEESYLHRVLGNEEHFGVANRRASWPEKFSCSIYLNFTIANSTRERAHLISALKGKKGVYIEKPDFSDEGRIRFLTCLREYDFIPCPVGNGIDTHRIWETLYMGGVPVLKRHPILNPLLVGLPVIFVKSWAELIDEDLMHQKWEEVNKVKSDFDMLKVSFHVNRIEML